MLAQVKGVKLGEGGEFFVCGAWVAHVVTSLVCNRKKTVRTELVEVFTSPSTGSGRTGMVLAA